MKSSKQELATTKKHDNKSKKTAANTGSVDWKDPKLIAEMMVAAGIIVVFMAVTGAFGTISL